MICLYGGVKKRVDSEKWFGVLLATDLIVSSSAWPVIREVCQDDSMLAEMAGSI